MDELVRYIAKSIVDKPDAVQVNQVETDEEITVELRVDPDDMGKVIGKQGRIAKAIRTVVKAATPRDSKPCYVEIIEEDE
ncbi:MAG: KH domain-containing protein [Clostridiales bacterium]|nr:KH domain-containing protein [Clostridiales bacterium]